MEYLKAEGFDRAIIGIDMVGQRIVYDKFTMCSILIEQGFYEQDAIEFLAYNVWGAYVGKHTPIYMDVMQIHEIEELWK